MITIRFEGKESIEDITAAIKAAIRASCDRTRRCTRKIRYGHKETAESAIVAMAKKGIIGLTEYECEFCDGWHVGH